METLALADFSDFIHHPFPVTAGGSKINLVLTEAKPVLGGRPGGREPFALTFRGPAQPILPQAMYEFQHPKHNVLAIFIVPVLFVVITRLAYGKKQLAALESKAKKEEGDNQELKHT